MGNKESLFPTTNVETENRNMQKNRRYAWTQSLFSLPKKCHTNYCQNILHTNVVCVLQKINACIFDSRNVQPRFVCVVTKDLVENKVR